MTKVIYISRALTNILVNRFGIDVELIKPEAELKSLGLDSLDVVDIVIDVEKEFNLPKLSDENFKRVRTIDDLVEALVSSEDK